MIRLEPLRVDHAPAMLPGLSDPAAYAFLPDDPPAGLAALQARYRRQAAGRSPDGSALWLNWIIRRAPDGAPLGYTQATVTAGLATLAYHVFPPHWRQGIGRAALAATLDLVFALDDVTLARALVDTRNDASRALLASLGFTATRTIERADFFKGAPSDETRFELPRRDWRPALSPARPPAPAA
ncbi:MAG: GNAT family N-acetyltransferase [Janthinobacterium lividum]